jgi:glycosyltransferase involved in cell wall biosynthesis
MQTVRASIAMATYNGAAFITDQLESILRQNRLPFELIVTDDQSTDDTVTLVESFAAKAPFAVHIEQNKERLGYNQNFQRAASLCRGDIVLFSDQDDVWLPNHIETIALCLESDARIGAVTSNSQYVDEKLSPIGGDVFKAERLTRSHFRKLLKNWQFPQWVKHRALAGHGMAFRSGFRDVLIPFPSGWIFDQWVAVCAAGISRVVTLDEILTLHRQHHQQVVANRVQKLSTMQQRMPTLDHDFFSQQLLQWRQLLERLATYRDRLVDARVLDVVKTRIDFLQQRQRLREGGALRRAAGAMALLVQGQYHRVGRGWITFARDLAG